MNAISIAATVFVSVCLVSAQKAAAGPEEDDAMRGRPTFQQSGQLFTIQFTPGSRSIEVKLAGDSVASVDPDQITLFGKAYPREGKPRDLTIVPGEGHYQIVDEVAPSEAIELKIKEKKSQKTEVHRIPAVKE